jgi:hypothetical protein
MTQAGADQDRASARTPTTAVVAARRAQPLRSPTTHAAILAILRALAGDQLSTVVPACPQWTVRDLTAHMTGVASDTIGDASPLSTRTAPGPNAKQWSMPTPPARSVAAGP